MLGSTWYKHQEGLAKQGKHLVNITALCPTLSTAPSFPHTCRRPHVRAQPHSGAHVLTRVWIGTHHRASVHPVSPCHTHSPHISSHIHAFTQICIYIHTGVHTATLTQDTHVHRHIQTCAGTPLNTRPTWPHHAVYSHTYLHPQTSTVHTHTDPPSSCMYARLYVHTHTPT